MKLTVGGFSVLYLQLALVFSMQPICVPTKWRFFVFNLLWKDMSFHNKFNATK